MNEEDKLALIDYVDSLDHTKVTELIITLVELGIEQEIVSCFLDDETGEFSLFDFHTGEDLVSK